MKNICIISECQQMFGIGGTETVSKILKEEFKENGFTVYSAYFIPKAVADIEDIQLPNSESLNSCENTSCLINAIIKNQINIVILQGAPVKGLLELCIKVKKATNIKLIYTYHFNPLKSTKEYSDYKERLLSKTNPIIRPLYNIYFELKRNAFIKKEKNFFLDFEIKDIDAFVSLNKDFTKFFQDIYPQQFACRFHTITNPIVLDNLVATYNKDNIILFVGRLTYQKRLDRLLTIWKDLQQEINNWRLVIVGSGDYAIEYQKIARKLKLQRIEFVGQQESEEWYKKSKIVCMTSSHESFGMVLVEAQKYGCVPIAYNSFEAATDIIENGHNGLLITPFKKKQYKQALKGLITDEYTLKLLASNGKDFIKKFDSKIIIKDWIHLINKLLLSTEN